MYHHYQIIYRSVIFSIKSHHCQYYPFHIIIINKTNITSSSSNPNSIKDLCLKKRKDGINSEGRINQNLLFNSILVLTDFVVFKKQKST